MGKYEEEYTSLISLKKTHVKKIEDMAYYMSWISPLKTLTGKIGDITYCCTDIVSLKTFYEKPLWEKKNSEEKEYNMMFEHVIFQENYPWTLQLSKSLNVGWT